MPSRLTLSILCLSEITRTHSARYPSMRSGRVAPIHDIKIDTEVEKISNEGAILLKVCHCVAADQPVDDQHWGRDLCVSQGSVVVQRHLVLPPNLIFRRGSDGDFAVAELGKDFGAARDLFAKSCSLRDRLLGSDVDGRSAIR